MELISKNSFSKTTLHLRHQLESQLTESDKMTIKLSFSGITDPKTKKDFEFILDQSKVLSNEFEFRFWGHSRTLYDDGVFKDSKSEYIDQYIRDTADNLKIMSETLAGGNVRVYILSDTGDPELGFQHLVPQSYIDGGGNEIIYHEALRTRVWLPKKKPYFDIDLSSSDSSVILEHLARIMLSTTDLILFKEEGAAFTDNDIFAVSHSGFFKPNEIYSVVSDFERIPHYYNSPYYYNPMTVDQQEFDAIGWFNHMGLSTPEFFVYLDTVFDDAGNPLNDYLFKNPLRS